ncbi:thiazole biosynthesis adenylyltransferase ThiF [Priestia filamentosa]|uniref:thiazole biosynthesis adenylyltransferase ThiF n=1 Tax=Priestia filamentosa TaxID=1402861 RepID=UPI001FB4EC3A|nr:thiazole biosynthesis adenylyltransferase ThiF [Priestia filamentosa]MED3726675.1 thiazole biosynthesis adenylyltransferase ThiF [Priestia filamentosa]UOE60046.1 thiazole biosynthesis adenylyltransferase ThiF [Priestia filamentosa]
MTRYSRQELFAPIGKKGQGNIAKKHVLMIGAGALGTGNAEALVRAGIRKLTIVDRDYVEWSNLQRQQLYTEQDAKEQTPKAIAAKKRLEQINSEVEIEAHTLDVTSLELESLLKQDSVDLIMDATDNFDIRFIINDMAQRENIPWIYGACVGSYGLSYTILPGNTPCLHCLMKTVPLGGATCDTVGIIAPAVMMVTAYQVAEAMKILVEDFEAVNRKLVSFDLWKNQQTAISVDKLKRDDCPSCGISPLYPHLKYENQLKTAVLCGRDTVQIRVPKREEVDLMRIEKDLSSTHTVKRNPFLLSFEEGDIRIVLFKDGRVFLHGLKDIKEAKKVYHRYFG